MCPIGAGFLCRLPESAAEPDAQRGKLPQVRAALFLPDALEVGVPGKRVVRLPDGEPAGDEAARRLLGGEGLRRFSRDGADEVMADVADLAVVFGEDEEFLLRLDEEAGFLADLADGACRVGLAGLQPSAGEDEPVGVLLIGCRGILRGSWWGASSGFRRRCSWKSS